VNVRFLGNAQSASATGVVVVVDVLRDFSFAAYALSLGVERIILADDGCWLASKPRGRGSSATAGDGRAGAARADSSVNQRTR